MRRNNEEDRGVGAVLRDSKVAFVKFSRGKVKAALHPPHPPPCSGGVEVLALSSDEDLLGKALLLTGGNETLFDGCLYTTRKSHTICALLFFKL